MNNPCYKCTERKVGCHSDCDKHKEWKQDQQKRKEYLEKDKEIKDYVAENRKKHR